MGFGRTLADVGITTRRQDYSVYPSFRPSIGFSQRGCRLRCAFCVVPRTEGAVTEEQTIADIWRGEPHRREVMLLDNDFFGQPAWRARVDELRAGRFRVCLCQGINARMLSEEAASGLASVDYRDTTFRHRRLYTAWDSPRDERTVFRGLDRLRAAGVRPRHVMVYVLIGYWAGETHADREYRRQRLRDWGALPYPMPYTRSPELVGYARWVLGGFDKSVPWAEWVAANYEPRRLRLRDRGAQVSFDFTARRLPVLEEETCPT